MAEGRVLRESSDRELMQAIAQRQSAALGEIYDRYAAQLMPLALRILGQRAEAEEVLGDVFSEVWTLPDRYDPARGTAWAYLVTLTRSRAIDRVRSRQRERRMQTADDPQHALESLAASEAGGETSPLESALAGERRRQVSQALRGLTPEQRLAIELAFYRGLSHSEISSELNEPLGTVKGRIRLGLSQLRLTLDRFYARSGTA